MSDQIWDDCCDYCSRVDGSKDESPCPRMITRCSGSSCDICTKCHTFRPGASFRPASQLMRRRPEVPKTDIVATVAAPKQSRIKWSDRPTGKVGP